MGNAKALDALRRSLVVIEGIREYSISQYLFYEHKNVQSRSDRELRDIYRARRDELIVLATDINAVLMDAD